MQKYKVQGTKSKVQPVTRTSRWTGEKRFPAANQPRCRFWVTSDQGPRRVRKLLKRRQMRFWDCGAVRRSMKRRELGRALSSNCN